MAYQKIGIDAGGTLIKIAFEEKGKNHFKKYPISDLQSAINWIKMAAPSAKVALTGGKAHSIQKQFFKDAVVCPEFDVTCEGASFLLKEEGIQAGAAFLLVNIGTGTSWHLVGENKYERILGSGLGGGAFMGLGDLLTGEKEFSQLTKLASEGEKGKVDLLVKDIYQSEESPIDGSLTAANFAKGSQSDPSLADRMASLTNMLAETIVLLSLQSAAIHHVKEIVYIGSTINGNPSLKTSLDTYTKMLGLSPVFLDKGEYSGAYGAMFTL